MGKRIQKEIYAVEVISGKPYETKVIFKTFSKKEAVQFITDNNVKPQIYKEGGRNEAGNLIFLIYADVYNDNSPPRYA